jgi:AraC-like DNA-binding protein
MAEVYIQAQVAVERGYRWPLTLATLAHSLAVSPRQLERAYDEIGLTTFGSHLRAVRLRNAAELLAHQPLTVTDVARLVGYRQPSHFVKAFRRRFGLTPGAFRDASRRRSAFDASREEGGPAPTRVRASSPASIRGDGALHAYARRSRAHEQPRSDPPSYSKPNSERALCPDPGDGFGAGDELAGADVVPAPAVRAESLGADADAEAPPPGPSKPNSARLIGSLCRGGARATRRGRRGGRRGLTDRVGDRRGGAGGRGRSGVLGRRTMVLNGG